MGRDWFRIAIEVQERKGMKIYTASCCGERCVFAPGIDKNKYEGLEMFLMG